MTEIADAPKDRYCDLVMKGENTSDVVYPRVIARLAQHYRFRSIGGTSAGAIAAVVTAAAEYQRRRTGSRAGCDLLEKLPTELTIGRTQQEQTAHLVPTIARDASTDRSFDQLAELQDNRPFDFPQHSTASLSLDPSAASFCVYKDLARSRTLAAMKTIRDPSGAYKRALETQVRCPLNSVSEAEDNAISRRAERKLTGDVACDLPRADALSAKELNDGI